MMSKTREVKTNEITKKRKRKNVEETFLRTRVWINKDRGRRVGGEEKAMEKRKDQEKKKEMDKNRRSRKKEIKKKRRDRDKKKEKKRYRKSET